MYLKTTFPNLDSRFKMKLEDPLFTCGSCFAQEFYARLRDKKFQVFSHPFGIVFNPLSIAMQFSKIIQGEEYKEDGLILHNGLYHSPDHHGSYSGTDPHAVMLNINNQLQAANKFLKKTSYLVITFGSAHYYIRKENKQLFSNCHKLPLLHFTKKRALLEEINTSMMNCIREIKSFNTSIKIILSVSPVRYLRDGFHENLISKSMLHLCCEFLCNQFDNIEYFPAYEIFMDDLRDYRYVKEDLVHPNKGAIDYIWTYFEKAYLSDESKLFVIEINKLHSMLQHKVHHSQSSDYVVYFQNINNQLNRLKEKFPALDFQEEEQQVQKLAVN